MNWLDIVLLAVLAVAAFVGFRFGLIGAAIMALGVLIGWLIAGQFADDLGAALSSNIKNDTLVTTIAYSVIMIAVVVAVGLVARVVRLLLKVFTLGMSVVVDRAGGAVLGLVIGGAIGGALIIGLARLTYDFETYDVLAAIPEEIRGNAQVSQIEGQVARIESARSGLEGTLTGSQVVSMFIDIAFALPANTLGFVPSDFKASLEILETNIDK
ncbi:MAG: hypothetical protein FJ319_04160 [SAR202 cluster bacterium]|nr:hypothetical protein [SAR202 cluster bacterium]